MRRLLAGYALALALAWPAAAPADQNDPRLDRLFAVLQTSDEPRELAAAQEAIWDVWSRHPDEDVNRLMQRGIFALSHRRLLEALSLFDSVVDRAPDFAEGWNKRATVHFLLGNLALSSADVDEALRLEPRHFGALSGRGQIEMLRGNEAAALKAYRAALEIHPHLTGARAMVRRLGREVRGRAL